MGLKTTTRQWLSVYLLLKDQRTPLSWRPLLNPGWRWSFTTFLLLIRSKLKWTWILRRMKQMFDSRKAIFGGKKGGTITIKKNAHHIFSFDLPENNIFFK